MMCAIVIGCSGVIATSLIIRKKQVEKLSFLVPCEQLVFPTLIDKPIVSLPPGF